VGKIFARLRDLGLDEHTLVFFCSDNGPTNKSGVGEFFNSAGPLKGWKGQLTEGGIRAPMIVRWPGQIPAGRTSNEPWAGWDLLPTLSEIGGAPAPKGLDGISVVPALRGGRMPARAHFYWEVPAKDDFRQAVRIGDLKAVRHKRNGAIEVYDLRADPGEKRDLAAERPDFVERARELFRTARTAAKHWPVAGE
jgi:arylsulfatase A-like enzyme